MAEERLAWVADLWYDDTTDEPTVEIRRDPYFITGPMLPPPPPDIYRAFPSIRTHTGRRARVWGRVLVIMALVVGLTAWMAAQDGSPTKGRGQRARMAQVEADRARR